MQVYSYLCGDVVFITIAPAGQNLNRKRIIGGNKAPEERYISPIRSKISLLWSFDDLLQQIFYYYCSPLEKFPTVIYLYRREKQSEWSTKITM